MIDGTEVTVLRGTSFDTGEGLVEVPTSEDSRFVLPTGPREFLVYLLEAPSGLVAVVLDAHELEFDDHLAGGTDSRQLRAFVIS